MRAHRPAIVTLLCAASAAAGCATTRGTVEPTQPPRPLEVIAEGALHFQADAAHPTALASPVVEKDAVLSMRENMIFHGHENEPVHIRYRRPADEVTRAELRMRAELLNRMHKNGEDV